MPGEKSLWFYGSLYRMFFDPAQKESREAITNIVSPDASVLDVGCGTGELAIMLRERKHCQVVGVDLSRKMVDYAKKHHHDSAIIFQQQDATDLSQFEDNHFDYTITCKMMHELPTDKGLQVMKELCRLGKRVIVVDYNVPLPSDIGGLIAKAVEHTFGRDHLKNFQDYTEHDGLMGIIWQVGIKTKISQRLVIAGGREQVVVLEM